MNTDAYQPIDNNHSILTDDDSFHYHALCATAFSATNLRGTLDASYIHHDHDLPEIRCYLSLFLTISFPVIHCMHPSFTTPSPFRGHGVHISFFSIQMGCFVRFLVSFVRFDKMVEV